MEIRFLHTADWQLGKPFASVRDDAKRHRLQQERFEAVRRLGGLARERGAAFVVVAGDLFDSPQPVKSVVSAACSAIGAIGVPVLAIPGNHDHAGPGSVWEQEFFRRECAKLAPNFRILLSAAPHRHESALVFPAPLLRRQDPGDLTAWIRRAVEDPELPADLPRIAIAHGSVHGFGGEPDDDDGLPAAANRIDLSGIPAGAIDYVALGDWHGTKQVGQREWYSGTPEVDRFPKGDDNRPGNVLLVTAARGALPRVETIATGRIPWRAFAFRFVDDDSLDRFEAAMDERAGGDGHLLLLSLEGSLGIAASDRLERLLEAWDARLLRLKLDRRVTVAPTPAEIAELTRNTADPLIAAVAGRLMAEAEGDDESAAVARIALRELYSARIS